MALAGNVNFGNTSFLALSMPASDHDSTESIDLGTANKFKQVGFGNIESTNNED